MEIPEAEIFIAEGGLAVECPHCGAKWYGWALVAAARAGRIETCGRCGGEFRPVEKKP